MWFLGLSAPVAFLGMLLLLAWVEEKVVVPLDRAARIAMLLESGRPEQLESAVAQMLGPVAPARAEPITVRS